MVFPWKWSYFTKGSHKPNQYLCVAKRQKGSFIENKLMVAGVGGEGEIEMGERVLRYKLPAVK